jgi:hypothetical protein
MEMRAKRSALPPAAIAGPLELSQTTNVPTRFRHVSDLAD